MKWIIDRFEGDFAIIECNNKTYNIKKEILPKNVKECDILEININETETGKRKQNSENLMDNIWK